MALVDEAEVAMHFRETEHGFEWGSAEVTRICGDEKKGWVWLEVKTKRYGGVQIYVTKSGEVRVFDSRGEWQGPPEMPPE